MARPEYAKSTMVYREIRAALDPWWKQNGYRRLRGSEPCWVRPLNDHEDLSFSFRVNPWGSGAIGGNSFYGTIQAAPSEHSAVAAGATIRQCDISHCLVQSELDELRRIQTEINRRRPRTAELEAWMREGSPVGEHTRERYSGNKKPYELGDFVTFGYYSIEDVRLHTVFLARYLPGALVRFTEGRCAKPKLQPLPPFVTKIYGTPNAPG